MLFREFYVKFVWTLLYCTTFLPIMISCTECICQEHHWLWQWLVLNRSDILIFLAVTQTYMFPHLSSDSFKPFILILLLKLDRFYFLYFVCINLFILSSLDDLGKEKELLTFLPESTMVHILRWLIPLFDLTERVVQSESVTELSLQQILTGALHLQLVLLLSYNCRFFNLEEFELWVKFLFNHSAHLIRRSVDHATMLLHILLKLRGFLRLSLHISTLSEHTAFN